jgi:hypothetical protein
MKQISRSEFVHDAGVMSACHKAVSRRPEKPVFGNLIFIFKNVVFKYEYRVSLS